MIPIRPQVCPWIGDGFAEQRFGIRAESLVYFLLGCIGVNEGTLDAQFFQRDAKQIAYFSHNAHTFLIRLK